MKHFSVDEDNIRADVFLSRVLNCSRRYSKALIKEKKIRPCGISASTKLQSGFKLSVVNELESQKGLLKNDYKLSIVYEDSHVLVINKPFNLLVHSYNDSGEITLVDLLKNYTDTLSDGFDTLRPGLVHRLDKATEGLMVIAKTNFAQEHLKTQFEKRDVNKGYYALVYGSFKQDYLCIEKPLKRYGHLWRVSNEGKYAYTEAFLIKRWSTKSLLFLRPLTGRTHQLRVHLFSAGYPIMGDPFYGKFKGDGQMLQSAFISFIHPIKGIRFSFSVPLSNRISKKC